MGAYALREEALIATQTSMIGGVNAVLENNVSYNEAMRLFSRALIAETIKRTGNKHRASLKLMVSHNWINKVVTEGKGAEEIHSDPGPFMTKPPGRKAGT